MRKISSLLSRNILSTAAVIGFMGAAAFAAAPAGGYLPGSTLDPDCLPGDTDCIVQNVGVESDPLRKFIDGNNNDVVLDYASGAETVSYTPNGIKIYDKNDVPFDTYNATQVEFQTGGIDQKNTYNLHKVLTSNLIETNPDDNNRGIFTKIAVVDKDDTANVGKNIFNEWNQLTVNSDNSHAYGTTYGSVNSVHHYGQDRVNTIMGGYNASLLGPTSEAGNVRGGFNQATTYSDKPLSTLVGTYSYASLRGSGSISNVYGHYNRVATSGNVGSHVPNLYGVFNNVTTGASWSGSITNVFGNRVRTFINPATEVQNEYGIYVDDVDDGSNSNYSLYTKKGTVYHYDNVGIGTTSPSVGGDFDLKLDVEGAIGATQFCDPDGNNCIEPNGPIISSNRGPIGDSANILLNANNRYIVTQTGSALFSLNSMFDGVYYPSYTATGPSISDPTIIEIEGLPNYHTQAGAWFAFTSRFWFPTKFKVEAFDTYYGNGWVTIGDYSTTAFSGTEFIAKMPSGTYSKIRLTIYEAPGTSGRAGISEIMYIHPEYGGPHIGKLPSSMWEGTGGKVGIGTRVPEANLEVRQNVAAETWLKVRNNSGSSVAKSGISVGYEDYAAMNIYRNGNTADIFFDANQGNGKVRFQDAGVDTFTISEGGNVGIANTLPSAKLDVNGNIKVGDSAVVCNSLNEGQIRYENTNKKHQGCNGTSWNDLY